MKKIVIAGAIIGGILLLLFVVVAGYFYFVIFGDNDQTLARNVAVTHEWTEIKIDPPVKPTYNHQAIYLRPINFVVDKNNVKGFEIRLPDGTVVEPEVEIYDEEGNRFQLHKTGFAMGSSDYVEFWPEVKENNYTALPRNRSYKSLRIRSDVPFVCERINWIDYSPP